MPIHPYSAKNSRKGEFGSPYSISDYYAVDPNYGNTVILKFGGRSPCSAASRSSWTPADHTAWDSVMMHHPEFSNSRTPPRAGASCRRFPNEPMSPD